MKIYEKMNKFEHFLNYKHQQVLNIKSRLAKKLRRADRQLEAKIKLPVPSYSFDYEVKTTPDHKQTLR